MRLEDIRSLDDLNDLNEDLHKWFKEKWVRFGPDGKIRGDCARGDDSEGKPKCLPQSKAHSLGKKGRKYAAAKKRREDPNPERQGKAINVSTKKQNNEGAASGSLNEFALDGFNGGDDEGRGPGLTFKEFKNSLKMALGYDMNGVDVSHFDRGMLRIEVNGERRIVPCNKLGVKDAAAFVKKIRKQGVAEGILGSDPNRGQKVPDWAKRGIIGKIGRKLDPAWSDVQITVPQHLLSKQSSVSATNAPATKEMPKVTSVIPTRANPQSAATKLSQSVTKNVVKTIADRQNVAEDSLNEFQAGNGFKPPATTKDKGSDPWGGDDRSQILLTVKQLLARGNKVDWMVPGARGHVVGTNTDDQYITLRKFNQPHSKQRFALPMSANRDSRYQIVMKGPKHYNVISTGLDENQKPPGELNTTKPNASTELEVWGYRYGARDQRVFWKKNFPNELLANKWANRNNATIQGSKPLNSSLKEAKPKDYDAEWDEKIERLRSQALEGPRKTVWDPVRQVYKTVPINTPSNNNVGNVDPLTVKESDKALQFATQAHAGQSRSGGEPYVNHPMRVADSIKQYKRSHNLDALIDAALLHDTIEDTNTTHEVLHDLFGGLVASLVKELTSDPEQIDKLGKAEYLARKMATMSSYALVIKLADRLDNVKDITTARSPAWRQKYKNETEHILNFIEKNRVLSKTHRIFIDLIRNKINELSEPNSGVTESNDQCPECKGPIFSDLLLAEKQDACYRKVKSRYKVWPSAYASGALVQCRKKGAKNWGNSK